MELYAADEAVIRLLTRLLTTLLTTLLTKLPILTS
jgi:hypothetical protein